MQELSETEMRIAAELMEAGEEDVSSLINSVLPVTGTAVDVATFSNALRNLFMRDYARFAGNRVAGQALVDLSTLQSLELLDQIDGHLIFNAGAARWKRRGNDELNVVRTPSGKVAGDLLLRKRGWGWYRK